MLKVCKKVQKYDALLLKNIETHGITQAVGRALLTELLEARKPIQTQYPGKLALFLQEQAHPVVEEPSSVTGLS